ncbi:hypothetical protein KI387_004436, partial [Taxus chinensis]
MDVKDENRSVRPKWETSAQEQLGQMDVWDADSQRSRKPIRSRHVSLVEKGRGSPIWVDQRIMSREALGHLGQKDAVDTKEPANPWTNQIITRVARRKVQ